jgi:DNA-binding MarR family transcriptional regulator
VLTPDCVSHEGPAKSKKAASTPLLRQRVPRQMPKEPPATASGDVFHFFNEVSIIAQLGRARFEQTLPHGLKISQFSVLNHFVRLGHTSTPARLATAFQVTRGAMTNTLQRLELPGFVSVLPDPKDGRGKIVGITKAGRAAHAQAVQSIAPAMDELVKMLGSDIFIGALPALETIRAHLDHERD